MGDGLTHAAVASTPDDGTSEVGSDEWNAKHVIKTLELTGVITPTALAANTNDYAPTGAAGASVWRLSTDGGTFDLTGIAAGIDGTVLYITCTAGILKVRHQNTSSAAPNRIRFPNGGTGTGNFLSLSGSGTSAGVPLILKYNAVDQRWDVLALHGTAYKPTVGGIFASSVASLIASGAADGLSGWYGVEATSAGLNLYINDSIGAAAEQPTATGTGLAWRAGIFPTLPTIIMGAEFSGTGAPTATLPAGQAANDILCVALQSSNQDIATPVGYTRMGPQNGHGAGAAAGSTRGALFWKRSTGGGESAPTIADSGDHTYGVMFAIRGCPTTGDPFHFLSNTVKRTASTSAVFPGGVTSVDECLVLHVAFHAVDNASGQAGSATNADLASITESFDDGTTDGTGGGITVISARKALAGPFGNTTLTWANSTVEVVSTIAFLPVNANLYRSTRPPEVQTFFGSTPAIADVWVKPTGARSVKVQAIGGGGGGSSGRNAATAAGGGGGGGAHYTERMLRAEDLAATVAVTAGNGGAVTANSDGAAGNAGANSTFGTLITAVGGRGATAAATADGGNGGAGGGLNNPAAAAVTQVFGGAAGAGGNGSTAPVGGSPAEYGGGGGESGADTDAGATPGGASTFGGGGGSSGRAAGTISAAGAGGGAAAPAATIGLPGTDSAQLPYGGSGANGGNSTTGTGGAGGFPGGGGGGGGTASGTQAGGAGGHGCVVVTSLFS